MMMLAAVTVGIAFSVCVAVLYWATVRTGGRGDR
jgi:hypothetical protein